MPEVVTPDRYADQIPRFVLPPELTNAADTPETPAVKVETPVKPLETPAAPPKTEAKPATEAVATLPETEVEEPGKETTEKDPEKTSQRRFERRIDRAHKRAAEALARAEALERENAELKAKTAPLASTGAPKMEDFTDIGEFQKAVEKYVRESTIKEIEDKRKSEVYKAAELKLTQDWSASVEKAYSKYDDWDEIVGDLDNKFPMNIAIKQEENGADIAYYLGKNRKEVDRILGLNPGGQFREIGKLSAKLSATPEPPKTPSKAPPPITPVTGEAKAVTPELGEPMPYEQYKSLGNKMFRGR